MSLRYCTAALLFFLGTMFLALGGEKGEALRIAIADKPMRSIALGALGFLGGMLALVLVAVTVVGIPFAVVGAILGIFLAFAATISALAVLGAMLFGHRSKNIYVHLAVGCAAFLIAGLVPVLGGLFQLSVVPSSRSSSVLRGRPRGRLTGVSGPSGLGRSGSLAGMGRYRSRAADF